MNARFAWVNACEHLSGLAAYSNLPQQEKQLNALSAQLRQLRQHGVDAIVLPLYWQHIAKYQRAQLASESSWLGLQRVVDLCVKHGFRMHFQLQFAETENTKLPWWLSAALAERNLEAGALCLENAYGQLNTTQYGIWAQREVIDEFRLLMASFAKFMAPFAAHCDSIVLGLGEQGEACLPYKDAPLWHFLCFSPAALSQLDAAMTAHYGTREAWFAAWEFDEPTWPKQLAAHLLAHKTVLDGEPSLVMQDLCIWYAQAWQDFTAAMLSQANQCFQQTWQHCQLGLNLPLLALNDVSANYLSGLNAAPWQSLEVQGETQHALFAHWQASSAQRLYVIARFDETQTLSSHKLINLSALHDNGIACLLQNAQSTLASHSSWDNLYQGVLSHDAFAGWVFHDLAQLNESDVAKGRLAQLNKFKYEPATARQLSNKQFRVMGPLHLKVANQRQLLEEENWQQFEQDIRQLRRIGVRAVSTDIWWGLVEGEKPGRFDWSYYDRVLEVLKRQDMHWVPILSFHQAGGNVNDDFMQAIPLWLWGRLLEDNDELNRVQDLQYVSETGDASMEYVSLWADDFVLPYYQRFMQAFKRQYANDASMMDEINISLGPAGELRYPSYNAHDWGNYPNRGTLQCYSDLARLDWLNHLKQKFANIAELNASFGFTYSSFEQLSMPLGEWIFAHKRYIHNSWAREFLNWYHGALVQHGRRIYQLALDVFDDAQTRNVVIGIKIPGIHWLVSSPDVPRAAEVSAGLIGVHASLNSHDQQEYARLLKGLLPDASRQRLAIHFTCLEMCNKDYEGYSRAADLVDWMAEAANKQQVALMGENALAGELYNPQGWQQMARALNAQRGYAGLTLLRMQNFFDDDDTPMQQLKQLINLSR